jgi:uncharacterized protein (TIGR02391 family)
MANVIADLPDADVLLALEPEELAPTLLRTAKAANQFHIQALSHILFERHDPAMETRFPRSKRNEVELAIGEAWNWLQVNGVIVPASGTNGTNGWMVITRRGTKLLSSPQGFQQFVQAAAFPKALLHPSIAEIIWLDLARGDLERAVFTAFKAVEVAVREAAKLGPGDYGVPLMRKAFDKATGPLSDQSQPEAERDALAHLFAGAIGSYKNPHSHRTVSITDPRDAQEMVMLASHLLGIVDARRK